MGYCHYWKPISNVNAEQYAKAIEDIRKIVEKCLPILANGVGEFGSKPELIERIRFNGINYLTQEATEKATGDHSYETFSLPVTPVAEFDGVKTNRKPYDHVVVACLAVLAEVEGVKVSSDGARSDWAVGTALASAILKRTVSIPANIRKDDEEDLL